MQRLPCFVTAKVTVVRTNPSGATFLSLYAAANENGAALALSDQHGSVSPAPTTYTQPGTVPITVHTYQAQASFVVPVVAGRTYAFGCATTQHSDAVLPAGFPVDCQASYVCQ